jgi:uncharacterized membrane protein YoaK (UPF0700 family)|nr:MAG: DUF1275 domain-containing protein [Actinomycetota bacterium]
MTRGVHPPRPPRFVIAFAVLTAVTGVVEAVSFLGLGMVFTAVMTGNTLFLGFALAGERLPVAGPLVAVAAFSVGGFCGNRVNAGLAERAGERWLPLALYGEGALLAVAAMLALGLPAESPHLSPHRFVVIGAVSAIMGARNVTIIRAGAPSRDLPTTVVTRALAGAFISGPVETRLRRLATVLGMVAGAGLGALLLRFHPIFPLLLASVAVVGAAALCEREIGRT